MDTVRLLLDIELLRGENAELKAKLAEYATIHESRELLEIGRKAIEDVLIEMRDSRLSVLGRGNGLVCREANGDASSIIRMGPETALRIGFQAIAAAVEAREKP